MESCRNCSAVVTGKYCSACGEKKLSPHDYALSHFVAHAIHDLTHFDSKIFTSLIPLVLKPGMLTAAYLDGKRTKYIKPITLFILLNLFFFFAKGGIMAWNANTYIRAAGPTAQRMIEERAGKRGESIEEHNKHFTQLAKERQKTMFFFAIPALALVLLVAYRKRYYVEHLVYSIHFHGYFLLFMVVGVLGILYALKPLAWLGLPQPYNYFNHEPGLNYLVGAGIALYHVLALPRVYGTSRWKASGMALLLVAVEFVVLITLFQPMIFYWTFYTS